MRKVSYIYLLLGLLVCLSCQTPTSTKQDKTKSTASKQAKINKNWYVAKIVKHWEIKKPK